MTRSVLVVDDEPNIVLSLEFLIKQAGYEGRIARTGDLITDTHAIKGLNGSFFNGFGLGGLGVLVGKQQERTKN